MVTNLFDNFDTNAIQAPIESPARQLSISTGIAFIEKLSTVFRMAQFKGDIPSDSWCCELPVPT